MGAILCASCVSGEPPEFGFTTETCKNNFPYYLSLSLMLAFSSFHTIDYMEAI